jgi:hypothetical protein
VAIVLTVLLVVPVPALVSHILVVAAALIRVARRAPVGTASIVVVTPHTTGAAE